MACTASTNHPIRKSGKQLALDIETQTKRTLTIETRPTPENLARCNPQSQSPLFNVLPPEIRNEIFSLALMQHEDLSNPYPSHDFCCRPAHRARRIVSTSLLQTCRLIWLEANHCPMTQAVHSFWFDQYRRPPWISDDEDEDRRFNEFTKALTPVQHSRLKHFHIFAQMFWLERSVDTSLIWRCLKSENIKLDTLTITIRHSDWWNWEFDHPLELQVHWVRKLLQSDEAIRGHVSEFRLELETLAWKVDQLRSIVESLKTAGDYGKARWDLIEPFEESTWSGPTNLGGQEHDVYAKREKLDYVVVTLKWKLRTAATTEQLEKRWRAEGSLLKLVDPAEEAAAQTETRDFLWWEPLQNSSDEEFDEDGDGEDDDDGGDDEDEEGSDDPVEGMSGSR